MTAPMARGAMAGTEAAVPTTETITASEVLIGDRLYFHDNPNPQVVVTISEELQNSVPVCRISSENTAWLVPADHEVRRDIFPGEDDDG